MGDSTAGGGFCSTCSCVLPASQPRATCTVHSIQPPKRMQPPGSLTCPRRAPPQRILGVQYGFPPDRPLSPELKDLVARMLVAGGWIHPASYVLAS